MELYDEILKDKEVSYFDLKKKYGNKENVNVDREIDNLIKDGLVIEDEGLIILVE